MSSATPPRLTDSRCSCIPATRWLGLRETGASGVIGSKLLRRRSVRLEAIARGGGRTMCSHHGCHWEHVRTRKLMSLSDSWSPRKTSRWTTLRAGDASHVLGQGSSYSGGAITTIDSQSRDISPSRSSLVQQAALQMSVRSPWQAMS